jgi:hypothetical protein
LLCSLVVFCLAVLNQAQQHGGRRCWPSLPLPASVAAARCCRVATAGIVQGGRHACVHNLCTPLCIIIPQQQHHVLIILAAPVCVPGVAAAAARGQRTPTMLLLLLLLLLCLCCRLCQRPRQLCVLVSIIARRRTSSSSGTSGNLLLLLAEVLQRLFQRTRQLLLLCQACQLVRARTAVRSAAVAALQRQRRRPARTVWRGIRAVRGSCRRQRVEAVHAVRTAGRCPCCSWQAALRAPAAADAAAAVGAG